MRLNGMTRPQIRKAWAEAKRGQFHAHALFLKRRWWQWEKPQRLLIDMAWCGGQAEAYERVLTGGEHFVRSGCGDGLSGPGTSPGKTETAPDRPLMQCGEG